MLTYFKESSLQWTKDRRSRHEVAMDMNHADRANTLPWPPILYALALVLPWLLEILVPLPSPSAGATVDRIAGDIAVGLGWALMATGIVLAYLAIRSFSAVDTPVNPAGKAEKLVTFGLYNSTRNPMYLGALIAFAGLALATGSVWRWLILVPLYLGLRQLAVLREEHHLAARFGADWLAYKTRTPRWW
jgi:protein-S-isoprenylcysteine O-methyltransferase Ste14